MPTFDVYLTDRTITARRSKVRIEAASTEDALTTAKARIEDGNLTREQVEQGDGWDAPSRCSYLSAEYAVERGSFADSQFDALPINEQIVKIIKRRSGHDSVDPLLQSQSQAKS